MPTRRYTDQQEKELCRLYQEEGLSTADLARRFGGTKTLYNKVLKRNNVERRTVLQIRGAITPEQELEACSRYRSGENTVSIGNSFGKSATTIRGILLRHGVELRARGEAVGGLSPAQRLEVCERYKAGEHSVELARKYGPHPRTIRGILEEAGIPRRTRAEYAHHAGDSIKAALKGSGYFKKTRDCFFYLFKMARFASTHCKVGIAFDVKKRADKEYGDLVVAHEFDSRQKAFFLEQAVLHASKRMADIPSGLEEWAGASEIRQTHPLALAAIAKRFVSEIERLGAFEFALRYVPMNKSETSLCMQLINNAA